MAVQKLVKSQTWLQVLRILNAVNVAQLRNVNLKVAGNTGKNDVLLDNQTLTVKGDGSYVTTSVNNQTIDVALTDATKNKIDNAANKRLVQYY